MHILQLGDEYRSPIKTDVPTPFVSGVLDNNTQPFQADDGSVGPTHVTLAVSTGTRFGLWTLQSALSYQPFILPNL